SPYAERIVVAHLGRQQRRRHVLIRDRTQETFDRQRPDRCAARIGRGGEGSAVHHRVPDLDPGGPTVGQDTAGPFLQQRQQGGSQRPVGGIGVHGGGELAFQCPDGRGQFGCIRAADQQ